MVWNLGILLRYSSCGPFAQIFRLSHPSSTAIGGNASLGLGRSQRHQVHGIRFRTRGESVFPRLVLTLSSVSQLPKFPSQRNLRSNFVAEVRRSYWAGDTLSCCCRAQTVRVFATFPRGGHTFPSTRFTPRREPASP